MSRFSLAAALTAAFALAGSVYAQAQQPASTDGKSVPMEQAPSKIKTGKSKAKRHEPAMTKKK